MCCLAIMRLSILETLRRKEFYVVLALIVVLALWMLTISNSGAGRFAKDIVMQVIWLASFGLAAPLAARQVPADVEQKTVYFIMARPVHRWQYIFGRAAGAAAAAIVCFVALCAVLIAMLSMKGIVAVSDASLWQSIVLQMSALLMLCCTAVLLSTMSTPAGAITFSIMILAVMRYGGPSVLQKIEAMPSAVRDFVWAIYIAMPHFEFFNISQRVIHGWGALPWSLFLQLLAYGAAYSFFATAFAAVVFRKRCL